MKENREIDIPIPVEILAARPYIFAHTRLHAIGRACWRAWVSGPGEYLHAEYIIAKDTLSKYAPRAHIRCFKWDQVLLSESYTKRRDQSCFRAKDDRFIFKVTTMPLATSIRRGYFYNLKKTDMLTNISISITTHTDCSLGVENANELYWSFCDLRIKTADNMYNFSVDSTLHRYFTVSPTRKFTQIYLHNLLDIVAFMKTSRLNLIDFLPRFGAGL